MMTLDKLLNPDKASDIAKLSQKELEEFLGPYLKVTRPELAEKPKSNSVKSTGYSSKKQKAQEFARQLGIELNF